MDGVDRDDDDRRLVHQRVLCGSTDTERILASFGTHISVGVAVGRFPSGPVAFFSFYASRLFSLKSCSPSLSFLPFFWPLSPTVWSLSVSDPSLGHWCADVQKF